MTSYKKLAIIRKQIAKHIQQGETVQTIAKHYHVTEQHVKNCCKKFSVNIPLNNHRQEIANRRKLMAHCVAQGETPTEVATKFGVSHDAVYRACKINNKQPSIPRPTTYAIIATLQNTTLSLETIAQETGFHSRQIEDILQECLKANIQIPHRKNTPKKE